MKPAVLFTHIQVVTPMPDGPVLSLANAFVAVANGKILYAGPYEDAARQSLVEKVGQKYDTYEGQRKILWPAMANAHGHIPMTLMRNQADDANLHTWLFDMIFPREKNLTPEHVKNGTLLGMAEMIRAGTGTAADMYYYSEAVVEAAVESGMRLNVCFDGKAEGPDGKTHLQPKEVDRFMKLCHSVGEQKINPALLVHSIYLYEPYLYQELAQTAFDLDCYVQVHIGETAREVEECLAKYGKRPALQLAEFGFFKTPTVAAHCVYLDDAERSVLAGPDILAVHCPTSNLKLGSGIAEIMTMQTAGIKVGLGTDGAASNNNLDLYQEMKLSSLLAKGAARDASVLPADTVIRMATLDAQQGLGFAQSGCIMAGYAADLQILDADRPSLWPMGEPNAAIVYSSEAGAVESLMVDGSWLMYKQELVTLDEEKIKHAALRSAARLNRLA